MCGIAGVAGPRVAEGGAELVSRMNDLLAHRGPDGEGLERLDGAVLGHRRLAIVDLDGGKQPMSTSDGAVWAVVNGEIYNHEALRAELEAKGHRFRTRCDAEVVPFLYLEYGEDFAAHLRGMFAVAVFDTRDRTLVLARDRIGIKPLYYAEQPDGAVAFASEMKALRLSGATPARVDATALYWCLTLKFVPGPRTPFEGIREVEPGHVVVHRDGALRTRRYAPAPWVPTEPASRADAEQLRTLFDESVKARLMADVEVGAFLSGGVDSTAVVDAMKRHGAAPQAFTAGFEDVGCNESPAAAEAAQALGVEHHVRTIARADAARIAEVVYHVEEPLLDAAVLPTFILAEAAAQRVKVVMTGEGADEAFGGYSHVIKYGRHRDLAARLRHQPLRALASVYSAFPVKGAVLLRELMTDHVTRWRDHHADWRDVARNELFGDALLDAVDRNYLRDNLHPPDDPSPVAGMLQLDSATWLSSDLLMKVDKTTMAHGLEARVPFLERDLFSWASSLPLDVRVADGANKQLFRDAMSDRLPPATLSRAKQGFRPPAISWLADGSLGDLRELLLDGRAVNDGWLRRETLTRMVNRGDGGAGRWPYVYGAVVLEHWLRAFMSE